MTLWREIKLVNLVILRILVQLEYILGGVLVINLLSKAMRIKPKSLVIIDPKKEVTMVFLVYIGAFIVVTGWHFIKNTILKHQLSPFAAFTVFLFLFLYFLILFPLIIAIKLTDQTPGSIGIDRKDLTRMIAVGAILSIISTVISSVGKRFQGLSPSLVYALIAYILIVLVKKYCFWGICKHG